ncbi:hypothetical protein D1872_86930 [compost metagenome]
MLFTMLYIFGCTGTVSNSIGFSGMRFSCSWLSEHKKTDRFIGSVFLFSSKLTDYKSDLSSRRYLFKCANDGMTRLAERKPPILILRTT